jgi:hypothetical protein
MEARLFMVLLGSRPAGRIIEQHDIFFGIAPQLKDLLPAMQAFWPEAKGNIHADAFRVIRYVNGYEVMVRERTKDTIETDNNIKLHFINLGGYKPGEFEEYHYKMIVAAATKAEAIQIAKQTTFYKHTGFKGATSHIDDKYGIDVDDSYEIEDILSAADKARYSIKLRPTNSQEEDTMYLGYFNIARIKDGKFDV